MQIKKSTISKNLKKLKAFEKLQKKVISTNKKWNTTKNKLSSPKTSLSITDSLRYSDERGFRKHVKTLIDYYQTYAVTKKEYLMHITQYANTWKSYDYTTDIVKTVLHDIGLRDKKLTDNLFKSLSDDIPVYDEKELSLLRMQTSIQDIIQALMTKKNNDKKTILNVYGLSKLKAGDIVVYEKNSKKHISFVNNITKKVLTVHEQGKFGKLQPTKYTLRKKRTVSYMQDTNKEEHKVLFWVNIYDLRKFITRHSLKV
tara:strand:+ start:803 stop:1573 length:771 start_codon:yes stop_codon:yes gene_type:complete